MHFNNIPASVADESFHSAVIKLNAWWIKLYNSQKSLSASYLCTHLVAQSLFKVLTLGVESFFSIWFKKTWCLLGILKKIWSFSTIPRQFLMGLMLQGDETARLKECAEQWTYNAFGYLFLIIAWTPLNDQPCY